MAVMEAPARPAESALRWNPLRGPRAGLEAELPPGLDARRPGARVVRPVAGAFALEDSRAWARGLAMGQSRASQLVAHVVDPRPGERVLDLCAAPGAKTTHLAALARGGARITAVELRPARAQALRELAAPHGRGRRGRGGRRARGAARRAAIDAVLIDPPCTGLGVLSARPDARWRRREEALAPLSDLQRALLGRALALARPGGRVVYSTCTLIAEENEEVVRRGRRAARRPGRRVARSLAHPRLPGALLTLPHRPRHRRLLHRADEGRVSAPLPAVPKVLPSVMSADMLRLGEQLDALHRRRGPRRSTSTSWTATSSPTSPSAPTARAPSPGGSTRRAAPSTST